MNCKVLSLALTVIALSGAAIADTVTTTATSSPTATKSTYDWTGVYCNGQVKQDTLLSRLFIKFPLILNRGLIA